MKTILSVLTLGLVSSLSFAQVTKVPALSLQCKQSVANAIYKKYPSIKKNHGAIEMSDINTTGVFEILEVAFSSQLECSAGVEVQIEEQGDGDCEVIDVSEMDEQC